MKTPTLIVRLGGLYLLTTCSLGLIQLHKMHAMAGGAHNPVTGDFKLYLWGGLIVGLGATLFAGALARLLTFDSDQRESPSDFSDRLIGRK
jgi:hypothetical protein